MNPPENLLDFVDYPKTLHYTALSNGRDFVGRFLGRKKHIYN